MQTIVELPEYRRAAGQWLSAEENAWLISFLAEHPQAGVLIRGTGGIRKLRWGSATKGKSGGTRVIYYYHNESIPLFLLTVFGKSEKANLSEAERNQLAKLTGILKQQYGKQP